ncbi:MAG: (d)CMP kinase [Fusobacterium gastrosuis]|uniref:(d)CMP kinase n=1 Tax=Fusobacterium gastrosuis TaxID=1755100 RepID=UPI002A985448|nr:(d)CMP kinase [Fusobacteriaceae bacterium]MDY5795031.1 (d)CMP kinase [Fusobacterium gastrosuis]
MKNIIVAIDGPAGSGKSTIAKIIADRYSFTYIDTGAMYRMITLYCLDNNIDFEDELAIKNVLDNISLDMQGDKFFLNNKEVTKEIRETRVNENVSKIASIRIVRENLVNLQRKISQGKNVILDGRDIGTVVFPDAQIKIYLIASPEERANRRHRELIQKGTEISYDEVLNSIKERDYIDSTRKESPLMKADDAIELDSTGLKIDEVLDFISKKIEEKL